MDEHTRVCPHCHTERDEGESCGCDGERIEELEARIERAEGIAASQKHLQDRCRKLTGYDCITDGIVAHHILQRKWERVKNILGVLPGGGDSLKDRALREAREVIFGDDSWLYEENLKREGKE